MAPSLVSDISGEDERLGEDLVHRPIEVGEDEA
jgi:hypothetical protein